MKTEQNAVPFRHQQGLFSRTINIAVLLCSILLLTSASAWAKHIQFYNYSADTIEAAIEFDSAVIDPGQSATLYVSEGGYSLIWGPVGTGYPYNSDGEIVYEDTKINYFGDEDFPRFSQYHLDNGNWILDYASVWTIQFENHSADTVEAAIEYDSVVIPPGETAMLSVSGGGYSVIWGPVGTGFPYNTDGEVVHEETRISYFGDEDFPRFSQYHKDDGNWVLDYSSIWTIRFENHSADTVEAAIEFDSVVIPPGETAMLTVSGGGYSVIWGPVGTGFPYNTDGEVVYDKTRISYFGNEDFPRFSQYHWASGNWVLDYSSVWTVEFHNESGESAEAAIEFDSVVVADGQSATVSVSGGGYSLIFGPTGSGYPYNTDGEVVYEKTKVIYFGFDDIPLFEQYHWENGQWILDYPQP